MTRESPPSENDDSGETLHKDATVLVREADGQRLTVHIGERQSENAFAASIDTRDFRDAMNTVEPSDSERPEVYTDGNFTATACPDGVLELEIEASSGETRDAVLESETMLSILNVRLGHLND